MFGFGSKLVNILVIRSKLDRILVLEGQHFGLYAKICPNFGCGSKLVTILVF